MLSLLQAYAFSFVKMRFYANAICMSSFQLVAHHAASIVSMFCTSIGRAAFCGTKQAMYLSNVPQVYKVSTFLHICISTGCGLGIKRPSDVYVTTRVTIYKPTMYRHQ